MARAYGFGSIGGFEESNLAATKTNYRSVTLLYNEAFVHASADAVKMCRIIAIELAASTLGPLPDRILSKRSRDQ